MRARSVVLAEAAGCRNDFLQDVPPSDFLSFYLSGCQTAQFDSLPPLLFWKVLLSLRGLLIFCRIMFPHVFKARGEADKTPKPAASPQWLALPLRKRPNPTFTFQTVNVLTTAYCTSLLHSQQQRYRCHWIITLYP